MTKTKCTLIARSLILTQGRGKNRQNEKKIVLELFACMLVIHQNGALLRNMATVKHCHNFQHLHWYTFKGEGGGQKKCTVCTLVKMMIIMDDPLSKLLHWNFEIFCFLTFI